VTAEPQCYGVRRLNPFQGVLQAVQTPNARALSHDGVRWEIQVLTAQPEHGWRSGNRHDPVLRYFRFGSWTLESGLRQVPLSPIMDIDAMQQASTAMVQALPGCLEQLPFQLRDLHELWLLDRERRPLALLASTADPAYRTELKPLLWVATELREHGFHSVTLTALGVEQRERDAPRAHATRLEQLVRSAGSSTRWFQRQPDGSGRVAEEDRRIESEAFPRLLLREEWEESADAGLVRDYLNWCAPWLLTLQHLDDTTRGSLERAARQRASLVDSRYRLYPKIIHPELIDAARVEARLRRSG